MSPKEAKIIDSPSWGRGGVIKAEEKVIDNRYIDTTGDMCDFIVQGFLKTGNTFYHHSGEREHTKENK